MINTCKRCGKVFEQKHIQALCPECKNAKCVICGNDFVRTSDYPDKVCCSRKCSIEYGKQTGRFKKQTKKAQETRLNRYGTLSGQIFERTVVCPICNTEFKTTSTRQIYCNNDHFGPCPICGKPSKITDYTTMEVPTCSEECRLEKIRRTTKERYGEDCVFKTDYQKEKAKATMLEKHGVEHYSQTEAHKLYMSKIMPQKYQKSAEQRCQTNIDRYDAPYPMMNEEVKAKSRETFEREHGGIGAASPEINTRIRQTNLEKYGFENPMQNPEIRMKCYHTLVEKYGEEYWNHEQIRGSRIRTNLEKYGAEEYFSSQEFKDKCHDIWMGKYGVDNPFKSQEIQQKIKQSLLERYGVENPMQSEEIRQRARETNILKYGNPTFKGSDVDLHRTMMNPERIEYFKEFKKNPEEFIKSKFENKPTLLELSNYIGCNIGTTSVYVTQFKCQALLNYRQSYMEQEVIEFLKEYLPIQSIKIHDRDTITPKELDVYLPEYKLGIECNPTYTHNSSKRTHYVDYVVPINYHQQKTLDCEAAGVQLIHIFGFQWTANSEIMKSMILNAIGKTPHVVYARKCELRVVSDTDSKKFLNENHIQGYAVSKVRLGLYFEDELMCLMTFSRKRSTLGHTVKDTSDDWELVRFCNKKYSRCVGGASKLFKYFVQQYHPHTIVSFSDRSNTSGNLYEKLGFEFLSYTNPNYTWVELQTDTYYNRVSCQKNKLRKLFNDPSIDVEHQSEFQIMEDRGFVRVYNSGLIKWLWKDLN